MVAVDEFCGIQRRGGHGIYWRHEPARAYAEPRVAFQPAPHVPPVASQRRGDDLHQRTVVIFADERGMGEVGVKVLDRLAQRQPGRFIVSEHIGKHHSVRVHAFFITGDDMALLAVEFQSCDESGGEVGDDENPRQRAEAAHGAP